MNLMSTLPMKTPLQTKNRSFTVLALLLSLSLLGLYWSIA